MQVKGKITSITLLDDQSELIVSVLGPVELGTTTRFHFRADPKQANAYVIGANLDTAVKDDKVSIEKSFAKIV